MPDTSVTPQTVALQAPLSMGFSRQDYVSVLPFPSRGHVPDPGIEPVSPALAGRYFTTTHPGKPGFTTIHPYSSQSSHKGCDSRKCL